MATAAAVLAALELFPGCACRSKPAAPPPALPPKTSQLPPEVRPEEPRSFGRGRLYRAGDVRVLELRGTPEEMGEAHGKLLGDEIRRVIREVLKPEADPERYRRILAGTRVMEKFQPEHCRREMRALAAAAGADYLDVVALQLFGDAERGKAPDESAPTEGRGPKTEGADGPLRRLQPSAFGPQPAVGYQCTSFAVFGPATRNGEPIAGRNFDYWYTDVNRHAALLIHYRPAEGRSFITLSWAGVVNGWTLMNDAGLVAANNNAYSSDESLEGISTCFLQRLAAERAATVAEGIEIVRRGPRAVGTVMLLAGGDPPAAAEVEFDHGAVAVRQAREGFVLASNGFRALGRETPLGPDEDASGRYGALLSLIRAGHGRIDRSMNFAAAPGVPIEGINLHCALLFPSDRTMLVSMGRTPACRGPFAKLRVTDKGVVSAE